GGRRPGQAPEVADARAGRRPHALVRAARRSPVALPTGMTLPAHARCVVIGCGIVGNSLAYHLTRLGWTDVVQIDKGPLPNPGGSTGHASNFIFPVDHSKEMTALTLESMRQYHDLDVYTECGGIEVARTEERMQELRRRMASAQARMAAARIPLTPAVHQMIDVGPVPRFATAQRAIEYPIVRDMDVFMYERQDGAGLEIGSYAHRPILHDPEEIPSIEEAALSP